MEIVFDDLTANGVLSVGALAFDAGGTLYIARPAAGAVAALDKEGVEGARLFAEGLDYPFGLAYHEGALYVAGRERLYRLRDADGDGIADERRVLVDDLPAGPGCWVNTVGVGPDERIYVSGCGRDDPPQGVIFSYAMDGSDEQVIAAGLHNPVGFAWHPATGDLWVTDSYHLWGQAIDDAPPDTLNRVTPGEATPVVSFGPGTAPAGLAFYTGEAFPEMQGHLLVVAYGSWNVPEPRGYELLSLAFSPDGSGSAGPLYRVVPSSYAQEPTWWLSENHSTFFPEHPIDVAVGPDGLIYIAVQEGLVIRIRPV